MKGRRQRVSGGFEKSVVASHVKPVGQFANARYLYMYRYTYTRADRIVGMRRGWGGKAGG